MKDRRRISIGIWIAAGAVLLLLYPLSVGPVNWAAQTWEGNVGPVPDWLSYGLEVFYHPVSIALAYGPSWLEVPFGIYLDLWDAG